VVDFLLQPTVPAPIMNARPRTSNPRSFCTVFPPFPQDLSLIARRVCLASPHSRQANNYDALLVDLFPAVRSSSLNLSRMAGFGRLSWKSFFAGRRGALPVRCE
jgi:hypothetical protein